jgi:hypothetical protein
LSRLLALALLTTMLGPAPALGADDGSPGVVPAYPKVCRHGLHPQPGGGPFAVLLFCDDAAGSHLAAACYAPGCGEAHGQAWSLSNRVWQGAPWSDDVTAFAWDPNGTCLYVSTSETYGTGQLFALNLHTRHYSAVPVRLDRTPAPKTAYATTLLALDARGGVLTYDVEYVDGARGETVREAKTLALPACRP